MDTEVRLSLLNSHLFSVHSTGLELCKIQSSIYMFHLGHHISWDLIFK